MPRLDMTRLAPAKLWTEDGTAEWTAERDSSPGDLVLDCTQFRVHVVVLCTT